MTDNNDLINIDFDTNWKCFYQSFNEKNIENTLISIPNNFQTDQQWTSVDLPHLTPLTKQKINSYQWCYSKQFNGIPSGKESKQQFNLMFENSSKSSNINGTIWLNNTQIFSGLFNQLNQPIELSSNLLNNQVLEENKLNNTLTICCLNNTLSLHVRLILRGQMIVATGQVNVDEQFVNKNNKSGKTEDEILDYTVSLGNDDGRIDVVFNSNKKYKAPLKPSSSSTQLSQLNNNLKQIEENKELKEDLLVPRLAIVIHVVGTRGDVQPFIA